MSRLDELIKELCPDGVEYKKFSEVCTLNARIGWQRLTKSEHQIKGDYMLITGTDFTDINTVNYKSCVYVKKERYAQDKKIQISNDDVLITKDGTLGKVAYVKNLQKPATLNSGIFVVRNKDNKLLQRYIMYYLLSNHFQYVVDQQKTGSTISHLTQGLFEKLQIPVPPMPIQEEIVRILDKFTSLTAELKAELKARKKQYEYYRDALLSFDEDKEKTEKLNRLIKELCPDGVEFKRLEDCCNILDRKRKPITKSIRENGIYPYYGANGIQDYISDYIFDGIFLLIGEDGSVITSTGKPIVNWAEGKIWVNNHAHIISQKNGILLRFLYHIIPTIDITKYVHGNIPKFTGSDFKSLQIPVPPLPIQEEIVRILDRFDTLCNDLSAGLPAEIEKRQKQYEYFRDRLLTFKSKE